MAVQAHEVRDLIVIGGGINGAGIAADAAGRGLSVTLCEKSDLGAATSSASSKMIHGGLRYLEYREFGLVRKALAEREVLLAAAPHIIEPLRVRLPQLPGLRPRWLIRSGLFLYDMLSRRNTLPASRSVRFNENDPLAPELTHGFEYSDCQVDDSRLVLLNAMQCARYDGQVLTRTECTGLAAGDGLWRADLIDHVSGERMQLRAKAVVNASGPWVEDSMERLCPDRPRRPVRLVKGSHIVVPRLYPGGKAYLLQHSDQRVVFVIPYEDDFTLIGTTEQRFDGDPAKAAISGEEIGYLTAIVNRYFRTGIDRSDIVHDFAGVRLLLDSGGEDASKLSRDYELDLSMHPAPLLTVYGGKITTYRRLAEDALDRLSTVFPGMGSAWTAQAVLPGGDFSSQEALAATLRQDHPWLDPGLIQRWVRSYGTGCNDLLRGVSAISGLGEHFGCGLHEREVRYLCEREWARSSEDILWRRTHLGLRFTEQERGRLDRWLEEHKDLVRLHGNGKVDISDASVR